MISFNSKDKLLLNWCFENLRKHTPNNLLFIYDNVKISKYNNFIENGYPHTNNNVIFLSENFINSLLPYYNENNVITTDITNCMVCVCHDNNTLSKDMFAKNQLNANISNTGHMDILKEILKGRTKFKIATIEGGSGK